MILSMQDKFINLRLQMEIMKRNGSLFHSTKRKIKTENFLLNLPSTSLKAAMVQVVGGWFYKTNSCKWLTRSRIESSTRRSKDNNKLKLFPFEIETDCSEKVTLQHTFRQGNRIAHQLAKQILGMDNQVFGAAGRSNAQKISKKDFVGLPSEVIDFVESDRLETTTHEMLLCLYRVHDRPVAFAIGQAQMAIAFAFKGSCSRSFSSSSLRIRGQVAAFALSKILLPLPRPKDLRVRNSRSASRREAPPKLRVCDLFLTFA
uniref:Uncharacterized protein LOC104226474 n=1 Tax=Nicotiana sylvestris TaxID=4096 RepID=A0A1U7WRC1_NICSY|nr:PREDICTED: uncharacterized protein LOC104226474 [Nicotiana sylvestris]